MKKGTTVFVQNVVECLPDYTALRDRRIFTVAVVRTHVFTVTLPSFLSSVIYRGGGGKRDFLLKIYCLLGYYAV